MENEHKQPRDNARSNPFEKELIKGLWQESKVFIHQLLDIRNDTDKAGTILDIKENISIKGHTAWVLVFSILICSIGLNISSPAVVIGAMLISPLMGPILGVGLSIGTNDIDTLRRSLINLGVMVGLSVATSFFFFLIPIFDNETPEILARTAPDVRDVFIAMAGGLALIIALSRRNQQTNTIAGVAIATALMPPLCTAGYGLATWKLHYFGGAMFLFTINAIFIALATFVIIKFLQFPMLRYINSIKRKRIARLASFVALIILGGSIYLFFNLFREDQFRQHAQDLINDLKKTGVSIIDEKAEHINYEGQTIKLVIYGEKLSQKEKEHWKKQLPDYRLQGVSLVFEQGADDSELREEVKNLSDLYVQNQKILSSRDESIKEKEAKIQFLEAELSKQYQGQIPFGQLSREAQINYPGLQHLSYARTIQTNFQSVDTLAVFTAAWQDSIPTSVSTKKQLAQWLQIRLELDTLVVRHD